MIQRIQSIHLLLATLLAVVCLVLRLTWIDLLQLATAGLCAATIFLYTRRPLQARLCLVALLTIFAWYIALAAVQGYARTVDALPAVEAILIVLARKAILRDEKLVRAADRIR